MRILKPLRIGYMNRIVANAGGHGKGRQVVVTGQICWDLMSPQTLYTDQKLWGTVAAEFSGTSFVLDHWMTKVRGEFLVCGKAVKPAGSCTGSVQIGASVGALRKRLSVSGDRFWRPGLLRTTITEPEPFSEMPIVYERAFGGKNAAGKEFSANPAGLGFDVKSRIDEGDLNIQLPNIEYPDRPVLHQDDLPTPASFGPVDMAWPVNVAKLGTYDRDWIKWRSPLPPLDCSPSAYNVAPQDQQLAKGFFTGDEEVVIEGMHAGHPKVISRLPGLAMRMFAAREGDTRLFEVPSRLDTVWLFPSALQGVLHFRGVLDCDDADARDISAIMMACEYLGQPRSLAHYEEVFRLRTDEATKAHYLLADDQLMPALTPEAERELEEKREQVRQARRDKWHAEGVNFKEMSAALTGVAVPSVTADYMTGGKGAWLEKLLPVVLPEDIARGNVDIAGIHKSVDGLKQRMNDTRAAASQLLPANRREEFGFSEAEAARGATFTKEETSELLNLGERDAAMAGISAKLFALVDRLNADPMLSISAEFAKFGTEMSDASFGDFIAKVRDPVLSDFLKETKAVNEEIAQANAPAKAAPESAAPELRSSLIENLREMAEAFAQGGIAPPETADPLSGVLKVLGIDASIKSLAAWPPGKLGTLIQAKMQQAVLKDGMAGMVELSGKLQMASLESMPAKQQAQMLPQLTAQIQSAAMNAKAYKMAYPKEAEAMAAAFANPGAPADMPEVNVAGGMDEMRKLAANIASPALRDRLLKVIDQGQSMMEDALSKIVPADATDGPQGEPAHKKVLRDMAAQSAALAAYRLPANDGLPEGDWLTYDKRYAVALAAGVFSRLGMPLLPVPANAAGQAASLVAGKLQNPAEMVRNGEKMMRDGRLKSLMAFPQVGMHEADVGVHLGAWIVAAHQRGESLAGRDLAGACLKGADLRGADLTGAFLERADLSDARLDGAVCDGIVLAGATLANTSFHRASLKAANFGEAKAPGAVFAEADLSDAQLFRCDFSHADLSGALLDRVQGIECTLHAVKATGSRCKEAKFISANLDGIVLDGAQWTKVIFVKPVMNGFSANGAKLEACVWAQAELREAKAAKASLEGSQFAECDCSGLHAEGLRAKGASWVKCQLGRADFSAADLEGTCFEDAALEFSSFRRARLSGAIMMRSRLESADMSEAQCMRVRFHNADLTDVNFRYANLHGADFSDAVLDRVDLTGTRIMDTLLETPRAEAVC